ncbi:MAG: hypothetical protein ABW168_11270 [Sedimenticola sp.]
MSDLDHDQYSISNSIEYYDCLIEVVVFNEGENEGDIEVLVRDLRQDKKIIYQSDDAWGCTGVAMFRGLEWAKNNDY